MSIKMLGKRVGVSRLTKALDSSKTQFLSMPEDSDSIGEVRYLGEDLDEGILKVGDRVYFGKDRHQIKIKGTDIWIMPVENIYAISENQSASPVKEDNSKE